jgi:hypothetical protein
MAIWRDEMDSIRCLAIEPFQQVARLIARGGLEEFQHSFVFKRRRIGHSLGVLTSCSVIEKR